MPDDDPIPEEMQLLRDLWHRCSDQMAQAARGEDECRAEGYAETAEFWRGVHRSNMGLQQYIQHRLGVRPGGDG